MDKSKLTKIAAAGAVVVVIAGYFSLQQWADDKADREVKRALIASDLDRAVRYGGVSASLLGRSLTLSDVSITLPDGQGPAVTAKKVKVSDLETYREDISAVRVKLDGISIPMLDIAKAQRKALSAGDLDAFIGMGYPVLNGSTEVYARLDPDKQHSVLELSVDFDDFGGASLKIALDRVDPRISDMGRQIRNAVKTQNPLALIQDAPAMIDLFSRVELADLSVGIKDRGIRKRVLTEAAESTLLIEGADRLAATTAVEATKDIRAKLDALRVDPRLSADIASKVGEYVEKGGELKLSTRIDRSIPLFERGGFLGIQPAPFLLSLDRFFALTGARIDR